MIVISCFKYLVRVWNLVDNILLDLMWSLSLSVDIALSNEAMFMGLKCFAKPESPVCLWSVWPSSPIGLCMSVTTSEVYSVAFVCN